MRPTRLRSILPLLLLAVVVWRASPGCASLEGTDTPPPEIEVLHLEARSGGTLERRFAVRLSISHPGPEPLVADGLRFDVDLAGTRISYSSEREFRIEPGEESVLEVTATSRSLDVYRRILALRGTGTVRYALRGEISRPGWLAGSVAFSHVGDFQAPPLP